MPGDHTELRVYKIANVLGEIVWSSVLGWTIFERRTIGIQLTTSCDSIAANIAEAFGRYHFNDKRRFLYYARGSAREMECWLEKAARRNLMSPDSVADCQEKVDHIARMLSTLIKSLPSK
jgi:four helix bundle protein